MHTYLQSCLLLRETGIYHLCLSNLTTAGAHGMFCVGVGGNYPQTLTFSQNVTWNAVQWTWSGKYRYMQKRAFCGLQNVLPVGAPPRTLLWSSQHYWVPEPLVSWGRDTLPIPTTLEPLIFPAFGTLHSAPSSLQFGWGIDPQFGWGIAPVIWLGDYPLNLVWGLPRQFGLGIAPNMVGDSPNIYV